MQLSVVARVCWVWLRMGSLRESEVHRFVSVDGCPERRCPIGL